MWENEYCDLGYTAAALRKEEKPYLLTHGEMFKPDFLMPDGMIDYDNFAKMAVTFYKYFVTPELFDRREISGIKIPRRNSQDYIVDGHSVVRRFTGNRLIEEIKEIGMLDKLDFLSMTRTCKQAGIIPPSMVYEMNDSYGIKLSFSHSFMFGYWLHLDEVKKGLQDVADSKNLHQTDDTVADLLSGMDIGILTTTVEPEELENMGRLFWVKFEMEEKEFYDCLDSIKADTFLGRRKMRKQVPKLLKHESEAVEDAKYVNLSVPHMGLEESVEDIKISSFLLRNFPEVYKEKMKDHFMLKYLRNQLSHAVRREELSEAAGIKEKIKEIERK